MIPEFPLKKGDSIHQVRNPELAAALVAVGVPLFEEPPYTHVLTKAGKDIWTFLFRDSNPEGTIKTAECILAWTREADFLLENPDHPFAYALAAVRNLREFDRHMAEVDPLPRYLYRVPLEDGRTATIMVKEGTKKQKYFEKRGFLRL